MFISYFGINSHTLDLAWYQNIGDRVQVVPGFRYYGQSAARFFSPANNFVGTTPSSSDYRLSAYGAVSANLKLVVEVVDDIKVSLPQDDAKGSGALTTEDLPNKSSESAKSRSKKG